MIPFHQLANGDQIPALGLGTFGSDKYSATEISAAVRGAIDYGYRHIDCASVYGNEPQIGHEFSRLFAGGFDRSSLWITSKVWNDMHDQVEASCEKSLRDLKLDYLDLFLVHWPFPHHHAQGVDTTSRDPHARPFDHDQFMRTWAQMERLVERGLVKHIGTSNVTIKKLKGILSEASIKPEVNEMEIHPHFQQPDLFDFVVASGMVPIGYCPIGSPSRPERDRTPEDSVDTEDPVIVAIAKRLDVHPAIVCILWQVQRGSIPVPFSVKPSQYQATFDAVDQLNLTEDELISLRQLDRNCRLIKGQVFLWEGATDWRDLWDE